MCWLLECKRQAWFVQWQFSSYVHDLTPIANVGEHAIKKLVQTNSSHQTLPSDGVVWGKMRSPYVAFLKWVFPPNHRFIDGSFPCKSFNSWGFPMEAHGTSRSRCLQTAWGGGRSMNTSYDHHPGAKGDAHEVQSRQKTHANRIFKPPCHHGWLIIGGYSSNSHFIWYFNGTFPIFNSLQGLGVC